MKLFFRSVFYFFAFVFFFQTINAQNRNAIKIDSLLKEAAKAKHDTTRYTAFEYAANIYQFLNPDSALFFHTKALQLAIALKDEIKRGRSILEIGKDHFLSGNNEKALQFYNEALQIVEKEIPEIKNRSATQRAKKFKGNCLFYLGTFYQRQNNFTKSLENFGSALIVAREIFDTLQQIRVLGTTGMIHLNLSEKDKALKDLEESEKLARIINNRVSLAVLYGNIGLVYGSLSDNEQALENYNKALKIDNEDGNTAGVTRHLINIISTYRIMGNYAKALEYAFRALKMAEGDKNTLNEGYILGDVAVIYTQQGQVDKAIPFFFKALKKCEEAENNKGIAAQYSNLGVAYMTQAQKVEKENPNLAQQKYALALTYYSKADSLSILMKNINAQGNNLTNMGLIYEKQGNMDKAIVCLAKAIEICIQTEDRYGEAIALGNLGSFYSKKGNYTEAEKHLLLSLKIAEEMNAVNEIKVAHEFLSSVYDKMNKPALAYKHYKAFVNYRDSLTSVENTRASVEQEMKFNFEKRTVADSIKVAAEKQITTAQLKQEKIQRYSLYGGLLLVALFAVFMFQRFRLTNKQKKIIEEQKHLVEEKHKEITDSINYAERIQRSFLATEELLNQHLKDYFVYFKPKDVVSGDFYWASLLNNKQFALVTADSTGHGVPGAIMSLLNVTSLEKAVEHYTDPASILNDTRKTIIDRLKKDGSAEGGKDGMDCSLISFNFEGRRMNYAAAYNPVWIVRNNTILEFVPDKMPVGKHDKDQVPFTEHVVELKDGDVIYTLTDGFPDQFGGPRGKKFKTGQLKELLISIAHLPMNEQKESLSSTLNAWKGNMEQVDDSCVIGIKV